MAVFEPEYFRASKHARYHSATDLAQYAKHYSIIPIHTYLFRHDCDKQHDNSFRPTPIGLTINSIIMYYEFDCQSLVQSSVQYSTGDISFYFSLMLS